MLPRLRTQIASILQEKRAYYGIERRCWVSFRDIQRRHCILSTFLTLTVLSRQRRSAPVRIGKTQLRLQPVGHWQACGGVPRNARTILILEVQWA